MPLTAVMSRNRAGPWGSIFGGSGADGSPLRRHDKGKHASNAKSGAIHPLKFVAARRRGSLQLAAVPGGAFGLVRSLIKLREGPVRLAMIGTQGQRAFQPLQPLLLLAVAQHQFTQFMKQFGIVGT